MACRKDHRNLTAAERSRFVAALYQVKADGLVDQLADVHETHFHTSAHHSPHFTPWHREIVRRFEQGLRSHDPTVTMPYWNSVEDRDTNGPLWEDAFLGQFNSAWNLGRVLGVGATLPDPSEVQAALQLGSYAAFWLFVEQTSSLHNAPHNWVGGEMVNLASPHDPAFYLHHCWIDLLWAQWQLLHPGAAFDDSVPGRHLNDPMAPWPNTPADVLDHRTINLYHYPAGMQPDLPTVTLETPTVTFLEVPEGEARIQASVYDLDACEPVHFEIVEGPVLTSGPAGSEFRLFGAPAPGDPARDRKARQWILFTGTAAGDTATGFVRIRCVEANRIDRVELIANTIPQPSAAVVMVLDQSNSMNSDAGIAPGISRAAVLRFSASAATPVVADRHAMAVCSFDHDAHPGIGMTPLPHPGKSLVNGAISSYAPNSNGWTAIGEALVFARDLLAPVTGYPVKAMVVLTDGQEEHGPHARRSIGDVADIINGSGGRVYAIGLGRPEVLNATALRALCNGNQGYMDVTGDLGPDATFRLAKYYQQIFAGVTNSQIVRDPEGRIVAGQEQRIDFWLNETDIEATAILVAPMAEILSFSLETPEGDVIDAATAGSHPMVTLERTASTSVYRVGLPIPLGDAEARAGRWHAVVKIDEAALSHFQTAEHPAAALIRTGQGLAFMVNVHAHSNLVMKVVLTQTSNEPGARIDLRASLTEYGQPVAGRARCTARIERPDGSATTLAMAETGPGLFEAGTVAALAGLYPVHIVAEGETFRGRRFTREERRSAFVWQGGDAQAPSGADLAERAGCLCGLLQWLCACCRGRPRTSRQAAPQ